MARITLKKGDVPEQAEAEHVSIFYDSSDTRLKQIDEFGNISYVGDGVDGQSGYSGYSGYSGADSIVPGPQGISGFSGFSGAPAISNIFAVCLSDEISQLQPGLRCTFNIPIKMYLTEVKCCLSKPGLTGTMFNVKINNETIFNNNPEIPANETLVMTNDLKLNEIQLDEQLTFYIEHTGIGATGAKIFLIGW